MNKRQVIILWAVAIVLGAAILLVKLTRKAPTSSQTERKPGQTLFESFPGNEVSNIEIQGVPGETVKLAKKDGKWLLAERDNFPANPTYVNELIRSLGDLKITRSLEAGPSFAPRFGMDDASTKPEERGLDVTLKDSSGKQLAKVSLGKAIEGASPESAMGGMMGVGRYIRNHADSSGFYASPETFSSVSIEPVRWLDTTFLSPERIKSISLTQKGKDTIDWKVIRETETAEFKLADAAPGEVLNATAAEPLKMLFGYSQFDDVVPAAKVTERTGDPAAKQTAVIETFDGFTYTIAFGPAKAAAVPPPTLASNPQAAPPATDNFLLTLKLSANLQKERIKQPDETPENAKDRQQGFVETMKRLSEKLAKEKTLEGRTFEVSRTTLSPILMDRAQMTAKATPPSGAQPQIQKLPGGGLIAPAPAGFPQGAVMPDQ